ncbi:MAG: sterol desaturase family protein [Gammaproteobacteria bacterium]|nr:sterol desaturase family protein [Gammaproteobacteria bacterium]
MNWHEWILGNEVTIRLGFLFSIFAVIAVWEIVSSRRELTVSKGLHWVNILGLIFLNSLILRFLFPAAAVGVALAAQQQGWGLIHDYQLPFALSVAIAVVAMDFVILLQHVMVHAIPVLWRLHRVHHADLDYDVTTGARFHTIEIILSMLIKFATIMVLGPPVVAVVIFEVLLNATAMFNLGNIYISDKDRPHIASICRHARYAPRSSFGSCAPGQLQFRINLRWWDRLFGTYIAQPLEGHMEREIGLEDFRDPKNVNRLPGMLMLPFVHQLGEYTINRRW